ncbi:MAG: ribonuclease P [Candidatus Woesearchaeota archaeon]|nr:ribonuclease P [Candidatus Woesearchaeota archaeon]
MKKQKKHAKKQEERATAQRRVHELFSTAAIRASAPAAANRLVRTARRLAMKFRLRLPSTLKRRVCKHCYAYLRPGVNCRVRLAKQRVIYRCNACKKFMRFPYVR